MPVAQACNLARAFAVKIARSVGQTVSVSGTTLRTDREDQLEESMG